MLKFLKFTVIGTLGILFLIVAGITIFFTVNDANDFKPSIELQAKEQAGVYLKIDGELAWSLIPLGITIGHLKILDQNQALFASVEEMTAEIDFYSLINLSPKVQTIHIDGLALELIQKKDTPPNWENILPAKKASTEQADTEQTKTQATTQAKKTTSPINFLVESFSIQNSKVHFFSESDDTDINGKPNNIDVTLKNIQLQLSNIALAQDVPLSLKFDLNNKEPKLSLNTQLSGVLFISQDLSSFKLSNFESRYKIASPLLGSNTSNAHLNANIQANTTSEIININKLELGFENLNLAGNINLTNYSEQPVIEGNISLKEFSLKQLLTHLGIDLPEMNQTEALNKVSLSAAFKNAQQQLDISQLKIQLDNSQWLGEFGFSSNNQAIRLKLKGDHINIDDYLPPVAEITPETSSETEQPSNESTPNQQALAETPLLPLDTIRALNFDIQIEQDALTIKQLETEKIKIHATAKKGLLKLETFTGEFYQGNYDIQASINASTNTPRWSATQHIQNIELEPIAKILSNQGLLPLEKQLPTGKLNLKAKQSSSGNMLSQLTQNATANGKIEVKDGTIKNISLNAMACEGLAMLNRDQVNTDQWPQETPFTQLSAEATLKQQKVNSQLTIITSGVKLTGTGKINTLEQHIDFRAGLYVIGDLGDKACRVNDKLKDISIPIRCKGKIDTPPAELCGLDNTRLEKELKKAAIKEGKRKAKKEIDRAIDKQLDKHLGKDNKHAEKLKNLLNKWL